MPPRSANRAAAEIASQCACFSLRKAARAVTQLYDKTLEASGLRVTQFTVVVALSLSEQLTLSQVAERLVMDRTTLQNEDVTSALARARLARALYAFDAGRAPGPQAGAAALAPSSGAGGDGDRS